MRTGDQEATITAVRSPRGPDYSARFVDALPIERAAISTLSAPFDAETVSASDEVAARVIETQLDAREGPSWDAERSQAPVLVPRLEDVPSGRWPVFTRAITGLPVRAIYSLPLTIGALHIGAVDLYAEAPDALTPSALEDATVLAAGAATDVLEYVLRHSEDEPVDDGPFSRREVHQATGMVIAQLRVPADEALLLIRAHAYSSGRPVREIAADITARRLTLEL